MAGFTETLTADVFPWLEHTLTIGVFAGATFSIYTWARDAWRRLPMIDHELEYVGIDNTAILRVRAYNRAPAELNVEALISETAGVNVRDHVSGLDSNGVTWHQGTLGPYVPGADAFPATSVKVWVSWPKGTQECQLRVAMRANGQWVPAYRNAITIKLPKSRGTT